MVAMKVTSSAVAARTTTRDRGRVAAAFALARRVAASGTQAAAEMILRTAPHFRMGATILSGVGA